MKQTPPAFEEVSSVEGNAQFGEMFFMKNCVSCHGPGGRFEKDLIGPTLDNPTLLGLATKEFWYDTLVNGRPGTAMPSWHYLSKYQLADLITYLESLKSEDLNKEEILSLVRSTASTDNGQKIYRENCASCHGLSGEGGHGPSLNNKEFQSITDDKLIVDILSKGRRGTAMPSWNHMTEEQVADLVAYIKSWQTGISILLSDERIVGSEREGALLFEESCQKCHLAGRGSVVAPAIFSKGFLDQVNDQYIKHSVMYGRGHTQMPPALTGLSGVVELTDQEINSIVAYIRAFEDDPVSLKGVPMIYGDSKAGKEVFKNICAQCHGDHGEGGIGPAIGKKGFLDNVSDGFIYAMMRIGRPGSEMKSFPTHGNGFSNLTDKEASNIVSFLRSNIDEAEQHKKKVRGYPQRGGELFSRNCAQCHGPGGSGGIAPALNNKNFMSVASDSYLQATMSLGRHGTQMRPMMKGGGGVVELSSQEVNDIISYLRSLIEEDQ